ncbi:hypothetical protein [Nocardia abscessus]|uniref:hypothetical protein n=1 Tax=Nocardia abscessus TaxID=120957 RepID=UPI00245586D6|nr:hypothetical protein [Nocardia abscessus]
MNEHLPDLEGLPRWKLRLLERIHDISAEHWQILSSFQPRDRSQAIPIHPRRIRLRALEADRAEIEMHAAAVGLPASAIEQARTAGQRGLRWSDSAQLPHSTRDGDNPVRDHMVEGVADDIWQLEHMAAINAERRFGRPPSRTVHHPEAAEVEQFGRNMAALWNRANDTARVLGLSEKERAQLWGRDREGWQRLVALTVATYDDAGLLERWRTYAWSGLEHEVARGHVNVWRGLEHEVRREIDNLVAGSIASHEPGVAPPTPHLLIERAVEAVIAAGHGQAEADQDGSETIAGVATHGLTVTWDSEPDLRPPEPGSAGGLEL